MTDVERGSQAIHRALRVLQVFSLERPSVSLTEITNRTDLAMPTAHRIVKALQSSDFMVQDSSTALYSLGPAVMSLAHVILQRTDEQGLIAMAMPHMERLRESTGETVALFLPVGDDRVCVAELPSRHHMRMSMGVGHVIPMAVSAAGRAILSALPAERQENILKRNRAADPRVPPLTRVRRELSEIAKRGYARSFNDMLAGASAVAAPIRAQAAEPVAAVCVTGPTSRLTQAAVDNCVGDVVQVAQALEQQLGYCALPPNGPVSATAQG